MNTSIAPIECDGSKSEQYIKGWNDCVAALRGAHAEADPHSASMYGFPSIVPGTVNIDPHGVHAYGAVAQQLPDLPSNEDRAGLNMASNPSVESALPSANSAFEGGAEATLSTIAPREAAQEPKSARLSAKPLTWKEEPLSRAPGWREWVDQRMGFHISYDPEEDAGERYIAAWGEGDPESFATIEEAKAWCQEQADSWVREIAVADAPPAPRSDDAPCKSVVERLQGVRKSIEMHKQSLGDDWQDWAEEIVTDISGAITELRAPTAPREAAQDEGYWKRMYDYALVLIDAAADDDDGMAGVAFSAQFPVTTMKAETPAEIADLMCRNAVGEQSFDTAPQQREGAFVPDAAALSKLWSQAIEDAKVGERSEQIVFGQLVYDLARSAPLRPVTEDDVDAAVAAYIRVSGEQGSAGGFLAALESFRSRLAGERA